MKSIITLILFFFLAACGSNPQKVVAVKVGDEYYKPDPAAAMALDSGRDEKLICEKRMVTGSHMKRKVCTTEAQKQKERRDAERSIDRNSELIVKKRTPPGG